MEIRTLCDLFYFSVETYRKRAHLRYKEDGVWNDISSDQYRCAAEELSMGLRLLGVEQADKVAIISENRPEWAFADFATLLAGAVAVPIYPTLTPAQTAYILSDSESKVAFVSTRALAEKIAAIRPQLPDLRSVIGMEATAVLDGMTPLMAVRAQGRESLARDPQAVRLRAGEVGPEDLATLVYTSGTTGEPKGAMLLHRNLVSNVETTFEAVPDLHPEDTCLSFLPLCHVYERMAGHYLIHRAGMTIAYAESFERVPANLLEIRPTIMTSVPRLYEKAYVRIRERLAVAHPLRQRLFAWGVGVGRVLFQHRMANRRPPLLRRVQGVLADVLVRSKIRARFGGRLRLVASGSAPLARHICEFFGAIGFTILEGYGLTETSPVITINRVDAFKLGTVGRPIPGVEVKIAEDGEILTRGPHVMKGYFKKPEATAEAIDRDGWFHTGDIGVLDADGFLTLTDRKKDIIVTSGGKNIAPQPIENSIKEHPLIGEAVMIGNRRHFPAALIVPNFERLEAWAREKGIVFRDQSDLVSRPDVISHFEAIVAEQTRDCAQFERIKRIAVLAQEFTVESGDLTPTLKVKRRVVEQKHQAIIDQMYDDGLA